MIVVRAPLRISFIGQGTDVPAFYRHTPGRVISAAIDKFVYLVVNRTPLIDKVSARYSRVETVGHPSELQHTRIKAALLDLGIHKNIEIASFGTLPAKTGLGASSSFSVALMKGLHAFQGKKLSPVETAEAAARLENELLNESMGKHEHYSASLGGFNVFEFRDGAPVGVEPFLLDYEKKLALQDHILVLFTGVPNQHAPVAEAPSASEFLNALPGLVHEFRDRLMKSDFEGLGRMLHALWTDMTSVSSADPAIAEFYNAGVARGAWGGQLLGERGGSVMFLVPPEKRAAVRKSLIEVARAHDLPEVREIPVKFVQSGAEVLYNGDHYTTSAF